MLNVQFWQSGRFDTKKNLIQRPSLIFFFLFFNSVLFVFNSQTEKNFSVFAQTSTENQESSDALNDNKWTEKQSENIPIEKDVLFCIGSPDSFCSEFALSKEGYAAFSQMFPGEPAVRYSVGKSVPQDDWPFLHPSNRDTWAGGTPHTFEIEFSAEKANNIPYALIIGYITAHDSERSDVSVKINGQSLPVQIPQGNNRMNIVHSPQQKGATQTMIFEIPAQSVQAGLNKIEIRLEKQSWILYDYIALRETAQPLTLIEKPEPNLLKDFRQNGLLGVDKIIFCGRYPGLDSHWYANFGYYAENDQRRPWKHGGALFIGDLKTGKVETLLSAPNGGVRDPAIDYDGQKIVFSYCPDGSEYYNLYEINADGTGLKQLTFGEFDDIEPSFLPNGKIIFVSTRCKRWVNCWLTQVATLHRCDRDGKNIEEVSSNIEHDNTPWTLQNGQVLYTRWEYVDRSQVNYHHLWMTSPDGTRQTVFFGNLNPGITMIDAKPVPDSDKIIASFSPGHGMTDHTGSIALVDSKLGPDDLNAVEYIAHSAVYRDPWAFSETEFMSARGQDVILLDNYGLEQTLFSLPDAEKKLGYIVQEPRPICPHPKEPIVAEQRDNEKTTGQLTLINIYDGRNMGDLAPGSIKKLLILETLPKPINFTGGMEPLTYGGSFTLERIVGTVPVEEDGSANLELPALRSFFFVALDENDRAVKRMQSFLTVVPGETTACIGCHEQRTLTPTFDYRSVKAMRREPSKILPIEGLPDVIDFPRDIQPILDKHCVECHNDVRRDGGVMLTGDRTPLYTISYYTLTAQSLIADGRNYAKSNYPPYSLGSGGSRLMKLIDEGHEGVNLSDREKQLVQLWLDTGATYPGTYAGLGCGMIGGFAQNTLDNQDLNWPEIQASKEVLQKNCVSCHSSKTNNQLALSPSDVIVNPPWEPLTPNDARRRFSRHLIYNLTNPDRSLILLAPLAKSAGGYESCGTPVFKDKNDPNYQTVLKAVQRTKQQLDEIKRFDMPGFQPRPQYLREMRKYGIIPKDQKDDVPVNPYELEQRYWKSLWFSPNTKK